VTCTSYASVLARPAGTLPGPAMLLRVTSTRADAVQGVSDLWRCRADWALCNALVHKFNLIPAEFAPRFDRASECASRPAQPDAFARRGCLCDPPLQNTCTGRIGYQQGRLNWAFGARAQPHCGGTGGFPSIFGRRVPRTPLPPASAPPRHPAWCPARPPNPASSGDTA